MRAMEAKLRGLHSDEWRKINLCYMMSEEGSLEFGITLWTFVEQQGGCV